MAVIDASLKNSHLWPKMTLISLKTNVRSVQSNATNTNGSSTNTRTEFGGSYSDWLLCLGEGRLPYATVVTGATPTGLRKRQVISTAAVAAIATTIDVAVDNSTMPANMAVIPRDLVQIPPSLLVSFAQWHYRNQ